MNCPGRGAEVLKQPVPPTTNRRSGNELSSVAMPDARSCDASPVLLRTVSCGLRADDAAYAPACVPPSFQGTRFAQ